MATDLERAVGRDLQAVAVLPGEALQHGDEDPAQDLDVVQGVPASLCVCPNHFRLFRSFPGWWDRVREAYDPAFVE